ncbi:hypothetical protein RHGRI_010561 [Rhododendron griersonianum]|uniref:Uncharacterized protein n=1 Tax=Rhododendron griersonianum TaxID=479676 RepID=A0AAV6KIY7_9ERIC|nr:hypothetical protein RHGRI_010561 [Rhododendron griersonianum]
MKTLLLRCARWSVLLHMPVLRSTGSFVATVNIVREAAFKVKNLHGNQSFFWRIP